MAGLSGLDWIGVDWGTTRFRAYAFDAAGTVLAQASAAEGLNKLKPNEFEPALLRAIGKWLDDAPIEVVICGGAGAREGWATAGYRAVPCTPLGGPLTPAPSDDPRLTVHIVPGLNQTAPFDVIRSEETQIAGLLALNPGFDGIACLPGTHTKWCHLSAGEVVSFQTAMTGDLFAAIASQTLVRHSLTNDGAPFDGATFDAAVSEGMSHPERLLTRLFQIRAESLLAGLGNAAARARASGLLIGVELAGARPYWLGQDVAILGDPPLDALYQRALAAQGLAPKIIPSESATRAGLVAAHALVKGTS